jgi:hypothetical protein
MAEGFLRKFAGDELIVVSTAVQSPDADPLVAEVMKEIGVDISEQHSKGVKESLKEHFRMSSRSLMIRDGGLRCGLSPAIYFTGTLQIRNVSMGHPNKGERLFGMFVMRSVGRSENS